MAGRSRNPLFCLLVRINLTQPINEQKQKEKAMNTRSRLNPNHYPWKGGLYEG